jgi:hypothetical protein
MKVYDVTTLEVHHNEGFGDTVQLETADDFRFSIGGNYVYLREGHETPWTRFCINLDAKALNYESGEFDRKVMVQLWITPAQVAEIVKEYFRDMLENTPRVFRDMLERLLRKRWSVMTNPTWKDPEDPDRVKPYYKTRQ